MERRPNVRRGGRAFQCANPHDPDLDDTAVVAMAMDRARHTLHTGENDSAIAHGREWVEGVHSRNGGFGAFGTDNDDYSLNNIPFADCGALLDPPTEDVAGRCLSLLVQLGEKAGSSRVVDRAIDCLRRTCALNAAGARHDSPAMRKVVAWPVAIQTEDGGWGEAGASDEGDDKGYEKAPSTALLTACALLGLVAAGESAHGAVAGGVDYLVCTQGSDGFWDAARYTATGFPRGFYLRYHGYSKFFPLWALARYRNLERANTAAVAFGM